MPSRRPIIGSLLIAAVASLGACGGEDRDPFFDTPPNPSDKWGYLSADVNFADTSDVAFVYFAGGSGPPSSSRREGKCLGSVGELAPSQLFTPGTVSLSTPQGPVTLVPSTSSAPQFLAFDPQGPPVHWRVGDTISVQSTGGEIPDFSATAKVAPAAVFHLPEAAAVIDRTVDLSVSWMPGTSAEPVVVSIDAFYDESGSTPERFVSITCHSAPGETSLVIPRGLLTLLEASSIATDGGKVRLTAERLNRTFVTAGDFLMTFEVKSAPAWVELSVQ